MPHETPLIATMTFSLAFALVGGFLAARLHLPPIVGYLLAGVAVGPFTPGFVADVGLAPQLAEIGVMLLLFGVGTHFSIKDLWAVRAVALPGAIGQIAVATVLGIVTARAWGWTLGAGLLLGLSLSVASTVVLLRTLEEQGKLETKEGRIAVGWLVVEDLVTIVILVLLPVLASSAEGGPASGIRWMPIAITLVKIAVFVTLMLLLGARLFPHVLRVVGHTGHRELFTLAAVTLALGVAFGSAQLFGVSYALGAFLAGVMINESDVGHRAAAYLQPLQDAFGVLFFVAIGMLFDPAILVREPLRVVAVLAIIVVGKSLAAFGIVLALRHPAKTALIVSASLAQIGEFSFILASLGVSLRLLPLEGRDLVVAAALLSITLNPFIFNLASRLGTRTSTRARSRASQS